MRRGDNISYTDWQEVHVQKYTIQQGFGPVHRAAAAALYWRSFRGKLGKLMGPDARALAYFETAMDPNYVFCAIGADDTLLGLAGFKTENGSLTGGALRDMTGAYGWLGGTWRALFLSFLEREVQPGVLLMDGICVSPAARSQGVGTALLSAVKEHARHSGLNSVRLDVIDRNPRARALYEREGFVATGRVRTGLLEPVFGFRAATTMECSVG